jgi:ATP-dependent exoDNAse (exonuclease V) alpha subunit
VAVTRARRRLYVIGNRAAWASEPHFDVLARNLSARLRGQRASAGRGAIGGRMTACLIT